MAHVKTEQQDGIFIISLTSGVTNPINLEITQAILNELRSASENISDISGLLLTSANNKFFSIGFDIPTLLELDKDGLVEFYDSFNELCLNLFSFPRPTISALTGHYVAAGCIIAACTDHRFLAAGKAKTGITAVKLGLPVPFLAEQIVRQRLENVYSNEILTTGELYDSDWAQQSGFVDDVKPQESLLGEAISFILNNTNSDGYIISKKKIVAPIVQTYLENKEQDKIKFINKWFSEPVQNALHEATKKY